MLQNEDKKNNPKRQTNKTIFKKSNPYDQNLSNCFKNNNTNFMYIEIKKKIYSLNNNVDKTTFEIKNQHYLS